MAEIKFTPLGDYVLVRPDKPEAKTKSGLVLTEGTLDSPKSGVVVKLGTAEGKILNGDKPFNFTVKVGTRVFWSYGGREIEIDGEKYLVIKESDILGFEN